MGTYVTSDIPYVGQALHANIFFISWTQKARKAWKKDGKHGKNMKSVLVVNPLHFFVVPQKVL